MRRFFLFGVLIICFLCAGFLKGEGYNFGKTYLPQNQNCYSLLNYSGIEIEQKQTYSFDLKDLVNANLSQNIELVGDLNNFILEDFKNKTNFKLCSCEEISGRIVLTGFSNKLSKFIYLNGERINIQISLNGDTVKIGSSLIQTSF